MRLTKGATPLAMAKLAEHLRPIDALEARSCGLEPLNAIRLSCRSSTRLFTVMGGDELVGMFGVGSKLLDGKPAGGVWMLGDDLSALAPARQELAMTEAVVALRGQTPVPDAPLAAISGLDGGPVLELTSPNDVVPTVWHFPDGEVALLNLSDTDVTVDGPGGTELLSAETASPGPRTLSAGAGEIWRP